jgi:hypothetical protein
MAKTIQLLLWLTTTAFVHATPTPKCPFEILLVEPSVSIKREAIFPEEAAHYPKDEKEIQINRLHVQDGKFRDAQGNIFYTADPRRPSSAEAEARGLALIVISEKGELLGTTRREVEKFHHSTLLAGQPTKFSGELRTNDKGEPVLFTYQSGHYPHGPWRMKLFLDSLTTQGVDLSKAEVTLSDLPKEVGACQVPAPFFKQTTQKEMQGKDILVQFFLEKEFSSNANRPSFSHLAYLLAEGNALQREAEQGEGQEKRIVDQIVKWVGEHLAAHPETKEQIVVRLPFLLREAKRKVRGNWPSKVLVELFNQYPDVAEAEKTFYKGEFAKLSPATPSSLPLIPEKTLAFLKTRPFHSNQFKIAETAEKAHKEESFQNLHRRLYGPARTFLRAEYEKKCAVLVQDLTAQGWHVETHPDDRIGDSLEFSSPPGRGMASFVVSPSTTLVDRTSGEMTIGFQMPEEVEPLEN